MRMSMTTLVVASVLGMSGNQCLAAQDAPVGSIMAWHKSLAGTPALPTDWVECNGQVLSDPDSPYDGEAIPDLNGQARFLRGGVGSGILQLDATRMPNIPFAIRRGGFGGSCSPDRVETGGTANNGCPASDVPVIGGDSETRPVNMSVVWIIRVKETPVGSVPAVGAWGVGIMGLLLVSGGTLVFMRMQGAA